jgi:hypothetical protein
MKILTEMTIVLIMTVVRCMTLARMNSLVAGRNAVLEEEEGPHTPSELLRRTARSGYYVPSARGDKLGQLANHPPVDLGQAYCYCLTYLAS